MSEPTSVTGSRLAEVMGISHDSVNRFLLREAYAPEDLFKEAKALLNPVGGTLSVDDTVLDKPYSRHMALVGHFGSGKHHRVVKGLNLITLCYTDGQGAVYRSTTGCTTTLTTRARMITSWRCWSRSWPGVCNRAA